MCISNSLFSFMLLTLSIVVASPAYLGFAGMPNARVPDPNCAKAFLDSRLGKRDDTFYVQRKGHYYMAYVVTSSTSTFDLVVDTGSSYTWVGARDSNPYVQGDDSTETPQTVTVGYAGDQMKLTAKTWRDRLILGGLTIHSQEIGIPTELKGFPAEIDGILGLGPTRLSAQITSDNRVIPTVVDNLYGQGTISHPVLGVYLVPLNVENLGGGGLLSFGGYDVTVITSDVKYVPVTQTFPASQLWGVDASFMYGDMLISGPTSGILDTGSVWISLPADAFMKYKSAIGADVFLLDDNQRLIISQNQYNNLQTLSVLIGDQTYDLSPNAQIGPCLSSYSLILLVVKSINPASGVDFRLGQTFFHRYYVVFNSSSSQIGFASHQYTYTTTN